MQPMLANVETIASLENTQRLAARLRDDVETALPHNTRRCYNTAWRQFSEFCTQHGRVQLPADAVTLGLFVTQMQECRYKASTIDNRIAAIAYMHRQAGHQFDRRLLALSMKKFRRETGTAPRVATPLSTADMRGMIAKLPQSLAGSRDCALLLVGFAGALRRSELVGLDAVSGGTGSGYVTFSDAGVLINLKRSKTDKQSAGQIVAIPRQHITDAACNKRPSELCPVTALQSWLASAEIAVGPIFRSVSKSGRLARKRLSGEAVRLIVQKWAIAAGVAMPVGATMALKDGAPVSAHSLRSGLVTAAARNGASLDKIMRQTRHTDPKTTMAYIRPTQLFEDNVVDTVGQ